MIRLLLPAVFLGTLAMSAFALPDDPYVVEEVLMPKGVAPEVGGLAFNSKGELVVVTRRSGILIGTPNADPAQFQWRVFSDQSLHEALGVLVEKDNQLLVPQFPELTRITDTDGDGVADLYETVCDKWGLSGAYHEHAEGPVPDGEGNWFLNLGTASFSGITFDTPRGQFSDAGRRGRNFSSVEYRGWLVKVKPDGTFIPWAKGFRANNGLCVGPDKTVWVTDNQGDYIPTSPLYAVEKGKFYGHPSSLVWDKEFMQDDPQKDVLSLGFEKFDQMREKPVVLFPHGIMINSPGDPIFDQTGGKFGPFTGQMFVPDESGRRIIRVMLEKVGGAYQGACVPLLVDHGLRAGNHRLLFSPDGSTLYTGQTMRGWGGPVEGLQRIVFNGKPSFEVTEMHLKPDGFELTFTEPVEPTLGTRPETYQMRRYYYPYTQQYGSAQNDITAVPATQVSLSNGGKTVRLILGEMTTGRIYQLDCIGLTSASGKFLAHATMAYTLNRKAE